MCKRANAEKKAGMRLSMETSRPNLSKPVMIIIIIIIIITSSSLGTAKKEEETGGGGMTDPHRWCGHVELGCSLGFKNRVDKPKVGTEGR